MFTWFKDFVHYDVLRDLCILLSYLGMANDVLFGSGWCNSFVTADPCLTFTRLGFVHAHAPGWILIPIPMSYLVPWILLLSVVSLSLEELIWLLWLVCGYLLGLGECLDLGEGSIMVPWLWGIAKGWSIWGSSTIMMKFVVLSFLGWKGLHFSSFVTSLDKGPVSAI